MNRFELGETTGWCGYHGGPWYGPRRCPRCVAEGRPLPEPVTVTKIDRESGTITLDSGERR